MLGVLLTVCLMAGVGRAVTEYVDHEIGPADLAHQSSALQHGKAVNAVFNEAVTDIK